MVEDFRIVIDIRLQQLVPI